MREKSHIKSSYSNLPSEEMTDHTDRIGGRSPLTDNLHTNKISAVAVETAKVTTSTLR